MSDDGLFPEVAARPPAGGVERGTRESIADADLPPAFRGLAEAALVAARALDAAELLPAKSAVYAEAQLMRPYQDAMHALGLPQEVAPVPPAGVRVAAAADADGQSAVPPWLRGLGDAH